MYTHRCTYGACRCSGFSGADMAALVREACVLALKESMREAAAAAAAPRGNSGGDGSGSGSNDSDQKPCVHTQHFEAALGRVAPSVSRKDQRCYDQLRSRLRSSRGRCVCTHVCCGVVAFVGGRLLRIAEVCNVNN